MFEDVRTVLDLFYTGVVGHQRGHQREGNDVAPGGWLQGVHSRHIQGQDHS